MSNRQTECNKCKANGFPNQMITFENLGEDPYSGKVKWRLHNADGGAHVHKTGQQDTTPTGDIDGHLSIKWLTAGKEEIIEALYNNFSKTHKIRFSQSHTAAFPNGVHFSICVYYEGEQE